MEISHLDRRTRYSLDMIRTALLELMKEKDLHSITVTDICKTADINRGTFYKYYRDVPDLFTKLTDAFADEIRVILEKNCEKDFDLDQLLLQILRLLSENRNFMSVQQFSSMDSQPVRKIMDNTKPYIMRAVGFMMSDFSPKDADTAFSFILGGTGNLIINWIGSGMETNLEEMQKTLSRLITSVLRSF